MRAKSQLSMELLLFTKGQLIPVDLRESQFAPRASALSDERPSSSRARERRAKRCRCHRSFSSPPGRDFEKLVRDLLSAEYGAVAEIEGRRGEKQHGIDICIDLGGVHVLAQCKKVAHPDPRGHAIRQARVHRRALVRQGRRGAFVLAVSGSLTAGALDEWRDMVRVLAGRRGRGRRRCTANGSRSCSGRIRSSPSVLWIFGRSILLR